MDHFAQQMVMAVEARPVDVASEGLATGSDRSLAGENKSYCLGSAHAKQRLIAAEVRQRAGAGAVQEDFECPCAYPHEGAAAMVLERHRSAADDVHRTMDCFVKEELLRQMVVFGPHVDCWKEEPFPL